MEWIPRRPADARNAPEVPATRSPPRAAGASPHLLPALAAVLAAALALESGAAFLRWRLPERLDLFARQSNSAKLLGNALQTAAFRTPGVMPIYGSSELNAPARNRADEFFLAHPEGFRVFPIGQPSNTCLLILEKLAAAGPAVRGKKVGIFLSPNWFLREDVHKAEVQDNVTPIQLGAWVFGDTLGAGFKRRFARRLLTHPDFLEREPLLTLCLRRLAGESAADRGVLALLTPLGWLRNLWLTRVDDWTVLHDLFVLPRPPDTLPPRWRERLAPLAEAAWQQLAADAETQDRPHDGDSPFSVFAIPEPDAGNNRFPLHRRGAGERDRQFAARLEHSSEWADLALLLDGLRELGADAVFISQPFNGGYHDLSGHGAAVRRGFYERLAAAVGPSGYPLVDFSEHEGDKYFFNDAVHPSAKAWIFYDHALDKFFHGRGAFAGPRPR